MEEEWQTEHFNSRRIGHGRKGKGRGAGGKGSVFDPKRSYGVYELKSPAFERGSNTLEIHGLVEGREDALMCSLHFEGVIEGVAVLAGSRKVLNEVIEELEDKDEDEEEDNDSSDGDDDEEESGEEERKTSLELSDAKERRRFAAFEKNSFRSPKFWMRWKGVLPSKKIVEVSGGYIVFSGNECRGFEGTISCESLGWKDVKVKGGKVVSKARECPVGWGDVRMDE